MRYVLMLILFSNSLLFGQNETEQIVPDTTYQGNVRIFDFNYGLVFPLADLKSRYGSFSSIGTGFSVLTKKNLQFGVNAQFFYGNKIKEDVLSQLRSDSGLIIGSDGRDAIVFLRSRGVNLGTSISKIISVKEGTKSGIKLGLGLGYTSYKIRVQDDSRSLVQALNAYEFGYDRKTAGFSLNQFIGYQHLGKNKLLNYFVGLNIKEAFTKHTRNYNFDLDPAEVAKSRLDASIGFQVGMMLVFYKIDQVEEIYY